MQLSFSFQNRNVSIGKRGIKDLEARPAMIWMLGGIGVQANDSKLVRAMGRAWRHERVVAVRHVVGEAVAVRRCGVGGGMEPPTEDRWPLEIELVGESCCRGK